MSNITASKVPSSSKIMAAVRSRPQVVVLIVLIILSLIIIPDFGSKRNILNVLKTIAPTSIMCCGMAIVLIGGNLDLSIGSTFSLLCVVSVKMQNTHTVWGVLVPIVLAVVIGTINGVLVCKFKINSIIVTLGTMSIFAGAALLYSNSSAIAAAPDTAYQKISGTSFLGVPSYVYLFIIVAIVLEIILRKTKFGKGLYFQGANKDAAEIAGVNVLGTTVLSMIICSLCVAFAAIIQCSRVGSGYPISGVGLEFNVLTAALLGGVSLNGGRGNAITTIAGVLMLQIIITGMILLDITHEWQSIAKGVLIIAAIIADARKRGN